MMVSMAETRRFIHSIRSIHKQTLLELIAKLDEIPDNIKTKNELALVDAAWKEIERRRIEPQ